MTATAIAGGRDIAKDPAAKGYHSVCCYKSGIGFDIKRHFYMFDKVLPQKYNSEKYFYRSMEMMDVILYHGSPDIVEKPVYGKGKAYNDYGLGFYCTEHIELAKEWACNEGTDGYANRYEIDLSDMSILQLNSEEYTILNWLAILMENRIGRLSSPVAKRGREYLLENFLPEYKDYDIIIGYRADDSYFSFARAFVENGISLHQLGWAMRLGKPGEQIVLKSQKAFDAIRFLDYEVADNAVYYAKRKSRDEEARHAYEKELEKEDLEGIYMRDIIREGMRQDDPCLR